MSNLATITQQAPQSAYRGRTTALCNIPNKLTKWSDIEADRNTKVDFKSYAAVFTLFCERHNRKFSSQLVEAYYEAICSKMGNSEFLAAARDLLTEECLFADFLPYLVEHVRAQRTNGPDPVSMSMKEAGYYD